jgi:hypothetical protein
LFEAPRDQIVNRDGAFATATTWREALWRTLTDEIVSLEV